MKLLIFVAIVLVSSVALLPQIIGQVATGSIGQITTTPLKKASEVRRDWPRSVLSAETPYPSVVHLKGTVEIRTNGFILRADEADYHEDTGEVEARGTVKVTPYPALK